MHEVTKNILGFFKSVAEAYDKGREGLTKTDQSYKLSLAKCGDDHDDRV